MRRLGVADIVRRQVRLLEHMAVQACGNIAQGFGALGCQRPQRSLGLGTWQALVAAGATYSSTIRCALVPETPKEEIPARRGRSATFGQGRRSLSSSMAPVDQSTSVEGAVMCRLRGRVPVRRAITIFIRLATPAAAWVWPVFDLIEPSSSGRSAGRWP